MRIFSISLGCPKNRVDTERMLGALGRVQAVDHPHQAEIVLINTCGFIAPAIEESTRTILETIHDISNLTHRPLLVVTGCLVTRHGTELQRAIPEVDIWLGVNEEHCLLERVAAAGFGSRAIPHTIPASPDQSMFAAMPRVLSTTPAFAYLKIGEGCNNRCRFCTIPSIRGPLRSTPLDTLLREAEQIVDQGIPELILVAQDITAYGRDLGLRHGLEMLLTGLMRTPGLRWLRLMYLYPSGVTQRLARFLADLGPPLLPYFDIPLQHAHPDILQAMGRPFRQDPRRIVDRLRRRIPNAALRTSLIVGHPGERPHHFQHLLNFVRETRFHHLGVFPYCAEPGTRTARLPAQVGARTKAGRRDEIMAMQSGISAEILKTYQHQTMEVLVEGSSPEWRGLYEGRVWFQAPEVDGLTYVSGAAVRPGQLVSASIEETKTYDLVALA